MMRKKNRIRILFCLGIVLGMVCALAACGSTRDRKPEEIQIGIVVYDEYDTFISQLMDCFMEEVSRETMEGKRITVKRYNAAGSQITENEQVEEMISRGCNVLCVNLVDRTDPSMIIEAARKADVPVIFFNRELVEKDLMSWNRLYYVGADAFVSGTIEGEIVADAWYASLEQNDTMDRNGDGALQYVMLEGEAGHQDSIVRSEYSVNALVAAGIQVEKCESVIANWNRAQAQTRMGQLINKYGDTIEVVLCNNDDMALGAIDEYEARGIPREERPVFAGIDGTDVGLEAVQNGNMLGTVYNDKEGQADAMLRLAIAAVTGEGFGDLPLQDGQYIRFPYERVTQESIERYLKK